MDFPAQRRDKLARGLPAEQVDALLISHPINVTYLTGFSGDCSVLILTRDRAIVVSDFRYLTQSPRNAPAWKPLSGRPPRSCPKPLPRR